MKKPLEWSIKLHHDNPGHGNIYPTNHELKDSINGQVTEKSAYDEAVALKDKAAEVAIAIGFEYNQKVKELAEAKAEIDTTIRYLKHAQDVVEVQDEQLIEARAEIKTLRNTAVSQAEEIDRLRGEVSNLSYETYRQDGVIGKQSAELAKFKDGK